MTEFETASLALREATLFTAIAHVVVAFVIGFGQIGIVWYGIRTMQKMGAQRARESDQRHEETMTALAERHAENMTALQELIKGTDRKHTETMTALQELIRRTGTPQHA